MIEVLWNFQPDSPEPLPGEVNPVVLDAVRGRAGEEYVPASTAEMAEIGRVLWRRLFLEVRTARELRAWVSLIPSYECGCRAFYDKFASDNPPEFIQGELSFRWKWLLKSTVNQKLKHADLSLEAARVFWASEAAK